MKKVGTLDYRVRVGDKDKTVHANMLEPYFEHTLGSVGGGVRDGFCFSG